MKRKKFFTSIVFLVSFFFHGLAVAHNHDLKRINLKHDDPNIAKKIKKKYGLNLPPKFHQKLCMPVDEKDDCFPTGLKQAITYGGHFRDLWQAEIYIDYEQAEKGAAILNKVLKKDPKNVKAHWLFAKNQFFIGERMPSEDVEGRDKVFIKGIEYAKKCIELDPKEANCKMFAGTVLGRRATNKGIINFLFDGSTVEDYWLETHKSTQHYRNPGLSTLHGAVNYALGVFYRLVPDSRILSFFFGFRGDIDKTIKHLKAAIKSSPKSVELRTEMTAALFCKWTRDEDESAKKEAYKHIETCKKLKANDKINKISQSHCTMLKEKPNLGCGYSRDRQQETDASKFKKK